MNSTQTEFAATGSSPEMQTTESHSVQGSTGSLPCLKTARSGHAPLHDSAVSESSANYSALQEAEAWRNWLELKLAIRRRAIKRQLRRLGVSIPMSALFNLNMLRAIRRELLVVRKYSPN
jgi:hypothetical protein